MDSQTFRQIDSFLNAMSTILLTGRNGVVGLSLVNILKCRHKIVSIIRRRSNDVDYSNEQLIVSDLKDVNIEDIKKCGVDMVVHLAATVRGKGSLLKENNVESSRNIFHICEQLNIPVLFLSSINSLFCRQLGSYACSKKECEDLLDRSRLRYLIIRVPMIISSHSSSMVSVKSFYNNFGFWPLFGKGMGQTQPVPVSSFVALMAEQINQGVTGRKVMNVIGQESYTYRAILENILAEKDTRFINIPYRLSFLSAKFIERINLVFPVSSEEILSINMDKQVDANKGCETIVLDNRKEIIFEGIL